MRCVVSCASVGAVLLLPFAAFAGSALSISADAPSASAAAGPYYVSNPTGAAAVLCVLPMSCDDFALTVTLPTPLIKSQKIQIDLAYDPASSPVDDMDLRLLDKDGNAIGSSANAPGVVEQITISAEPGTSQYTVQVVPYAVTGTRGTVTAQVLTPSDSPTPGADPCAQSGTATASVIVAPSVRQALQTLGSGASYGAFVHFSMGSQAEHTALFQKLGLSVVKSFYPYANSIFVRGPVAGFLKLLDERSVSYVEANEKLHYTAEADVWSTRARVAQEPVSGGPANC